MATVLAKPTGPRSLPMWTVAIPPAAISTCRSYRPAAVVAPSMSGMDRAEEGIGAGAEPRGEEDSAAGRRPGLPPSRGSTMLTSRHLGRHAFLAYAARAPRPSREEERPSIPPHRHLLR